MDGSLPQLSIIIPTKNRAPILAELLESVRRLDDIERIRPEIVVADNGSGDETHALAAALAGTFPTQVHVLKVERPGKSAAVNDAVKLASGTTLAFLDDDVVVDKSWLAAVNRFFRDHPYQAGQGVIRLQSPAGEDPEILQLVQRYRTIPRLEHDPNLTTLHSLNGANFFVSRAAFDRTGGFDERLGPGASGTSEDVDFARRLGRAQIAIGYAPRAVVYHRVDPERLTDAYFKQIHWRQGESRYLMQPRGTAEIILNLVKAGAQHGYYTVVGKERKRYRSKGRFYHYLAMMAARRRHGRRGAAP